MAATEETSDFSSRWRSEAKKLNSTAKKFPWTGTLTNNKAELIELIRARTNSQQLSFALLAVSILAYFFFKLVLVLFRTHYPLRGPIPGE